MRLAKERFLMEQVEKISMKQERIYLVLELVLFLSVLLQVSWLAFFQGQLEQIWLELLLELVWLVQASVQVLILEQSLLLVLLDASWVFIFLKLEWISLLLLLLTWLVLFSVQI